MDMEERVQSATALQPETATQVGDLATSVSNAVDLAVQVSFVRPSWSLAHCATARSAHWRACIVYPSVEKATSPFRYREFPA